MLKVNCLDGSSLVVDAGLIEFVKATPQIIVYLTTRK